MHYDESSSASAIFKRRKLTNNCTEVVPNCSSTDQIMLDYSALRTKDEIIQEKRKVFEHQKSLYFRQTKSMLDGCKVSFRDDCCDRLK